MILFSAILLVLLVALLGWIALMLRRKAQAKKWAMRYSRKGVTGRPLAFDSDAQAKYIQYRRAGANKKSAAEKAGGCDKTRWNYEKASRRRVEQLLAEGKDASNEFSEQDAAAVAFYRAGLKLTPAKEPR